LQGGHEGERDGLDRLVAGLRARWAVGKPVEEDVGAGFQPDHLAEPGRLQRLNAGDRPVHAGPAAGGSERVEAAVGRHPVQPGAQRGSFLETGETLPGGQQRVLEGVFRVLHRAKDPVAVDLELATVRVGELTKRVPVAGSGPGDQLHCHLATLPSLVPPGAVTNVDTARSANWALLGRPVRRSAGASTIDATNGDVPADQQEVRT
jgi:hypothetical protein